MDIYCFVSVSVGARGGHSSIDPGYGRSKPPYISPRPFGRGL